MKPRMPSKDLYALLPELPRALRELTKASEEGGLQKSLIELVKTRVSQINGCAYCLHMHAREARRIGEREDRLHVLAAWRESPYFTPRERAALAWAEALTSLDHGVPDEVYDEARRQFSDKEFALLTGATIAINGWNRVAVPLRLAHPVEDAKTN